MGFKDFQDFTQHNDVQHDNKKRDIQHNDIQHNGRELLC